MLGYEQNGTRPVLVSSQNQIEEQKFALLDVQFETNPLDGSCDQRVRVGARPLEIIYDAVSLKRCIH